MRRGWWEKELAAVPPVPEVVARPLILPLTMGSILAGVDPGRSHNLSWGAFLVVVCVAIAALSSSICCRLIRQSVVCRFVNRPPLLFHSVVV